MTIRASPHSTPIAAQLTLPSGLIVVTTVSTIGASVSDICQRWQSVDAAMRTLLIDNYDSFTFNLFHLLGEVNGDEPMVVRNDELSWDELAALAVDNIVISPGPGRPEHARDVGVSLDVLKRSELPVLGVCLGHQALAHSAGGAVEHAPEVMHGRLSAIHHDGRGLFAGIPQGFAAVRYHSLVVGALPAELRVTAWTLDDVVMGLEHRTRPLWGVQFHPESISHRARAHAAAQLPRPHARAPRPPRAGEVAEVAQQRAPVLGRDRLGMELHAPQRPRAVLESHHDVVERPRRDAQLAGPNNERVVSGRPRSPAG